MTTQVRYSKVQQSYLDAKAHLEAVEAQCNADYPQYTKEELDAMDRETFKAVVAVVDEIDKRHDLHGAHVAVEEAENVLIAWGQVQVEKMGRKTNSFLAAQALRAFDNKNHPDVRSGLIKLIMRSPRVA